MDPNPVLKRLGLASHDRAVIVHLDDLGMCHSTLTAWEELVDFGLVTSASIMTPCPWFPLAAERAVSRPASDVGVHLTLTCEWSNYRWGPVTTRDPESGLVDEEGCLPRASATVQESAEGDRVSAELRAQIDRAVAAGIRLTHVDTHMGTVIHRRFIETYVGLALERSLPVMLPRLDESGWRTAAGDHHGVALDEAGVVLAARLVRELEERGVPTFDAIAGLPLDSGAAERVALAKRVFELAPEGLSHLIIHAASDTPELRAIAPDWECRVADHRAFLSTDLRNWVRDRGITLIGYDALRAIMSAA